MVFSKNIFFLIIYSYFHMFFNGCFKKIIKT